MTNSEKFKDVFGLYATELWAMPQEDFLNWINTEYKEFESVQLDLISKHETIDILKAIKHGLWEIIDIPSPENVHEYVEYHKQIKDMMEVVDVWIKKVVELPSVYPESDEWCTDCKEYDIANHNCPRFNRVIRETVEEMRQEKPERKKGENE